MSYKPDSNNGGFSKDPRSNIPSGFEWESMEFQILAKMKAIEASERKKRNRFILTFLAVPIVSLLIGGICLLIQTSNFKTSESSTNKEQLMRNQDFSRIEVESAPSEVSRPASSNDESTSTKQREVEVITSKKAALNILNATNQNKPTNSKNGISSEEISSSGDMLPDTPINDLVLNAGISAFDSESGMSADTVLGENNLISAVQESAQFDSILESNLPENSKEVMKKAMRFGVEAGINLWTDVSNSVIWSKESFTTPQVSSQIQGYFQRDISPSIFVITTAQFRQFNSRLNYKTTITDFNLVLTDTVIQVNRNLLTGELVKIYGDVNELTEAERLVIHHNTSNTYNFSLGFGNSFQYKYFQADLYYGLALNGFSSHSGRIVLNGDVISYGQGQNNIVNTQLALDLLTGVRIHYAVNSTLSLTSAINIQQNITNWSTIDSRKLYPISAGLNVGISYRL